MADLNISSGVYKGRKSALDSTSSNCSVSELHSIFNLSQATARIEREVLSNQFAGATNGQCCLRQLKKSISDKIDKVELLDIQSQRRPSVITPTPPGSPKVQRASTPLAQRAHIPPNPNSRISFGQYHLDIPPNSPTCSEISSIGGEVFQVEESLEPVLQSIPTKLVSNSKMEQAEEALDDKLSLLRLRMRMYQVSQLNSGNLDQHEAKMKDREQVFEDTHLAMRKLIQKFSSQLSQERVSELKNQIPSLEQEFLIYMESFASKLTELKNVPSIINRASSEVPSMSNLSLSDSFQGRQNAAKRKVKAKLETVMEDLISLSKKACEVQDWSAASDLVVGRAMKENEKLRKEYTRINNVRRDIDELMAEYDLDEARDGLSVQECDLKLHEVHEEVEETVKAVVEEDNARELYSLDEAKVDKVKLPTFGGKESEDYEKFKSDLLKGFAQNRVTQADKLSKLRECLYGEAKKLVPHSISSSADDAFKVLDEA